MRLFKRHSAPAEKTRAEKNMEKFFDWDYDLYENARRHARIAWVVAGLASLLALVAVTGLAALGPLKTIEPVFVRVDNATGAVDVLYNVEEETGISRQDLLDKANLARYVRAREGYFYPVAKEQYRAVMRMSVGQARAQFRAGFSQENPSSPVNVYQDHKRADIKMKSISFIGTGLAQVRFVATVSDGEDSERHHRIATIAYDYEPDASIPLSALADNALGFAVTEYRSEPEDAS
ncbi:MAG: type IV secretion system protein [Thiohalocapsa sp.]